MASTKNCANGGPTSDPYEQSVAYLTEATKVRPQVAVIAGSGLGGLGDLVQDPVSIPYQDIPNFPQSSVAGHAGKLVFGTIEKTPVVVMCGRFHGYEGIDLLTSAYPVRVFKLLGVKVLIVTNAAGGLNEKYSPGDLVLVQDHINFPGRKMLEGGRNEQLKRLKEQLNRQ